MSDITVGGVSFIGPFHEEWRVTIDGYEVPRITAIPQTDSGLVVLSLDRRFLIEGTPEECAKWIGFIAHAMAIGAGYSCFGEHSVRDPNPYALRVTEIGTAPVLPWGNRGGKQ